MQGKLIASYRRELSALDDLQCAGTVTYTLTQEADAFVITVQRDGARAAACMLFEGLLKELRRRLEPTV